MLHVWTREHLWLRPGVFSFSPYSEPCLCCALYSPGGCMLKDMHRQAVLAGQSMTCSRYMPRRGARQDTHHRGRR